MQINAIHKASCHCGKVKLEVFLPKGLGKLSRCDGSMCRRRGAIVISIPLDALKVVEGHAALSLYQFNTMTAKHYFCSTCGIYTHHQMRSNPSEYDVNVGCLDGVNPFELGEVRMFNGINHPSDIDK